MGVPGQRDLGGEPLASIPYLILPPPGCGVPAIHPVLSGLSRIINGEDAVPGSWPCERGILPLSGLEYWPSWDRLGAAGIQLALTSLSSFRTALASTSAGGSLISED